MEAAHRRSAERVRSLIATARATPPDLRAAITSVPPAERDAWLDLVLGIDGIPDDGPELPRGCVPYWPCGVNTLLQGVEAAGIRDTDVFVDVGSGLGRTAAFVHLLTGAPAIGLEIQPALVRAARALATRLNASRLAFVEGDAALLAGYIPIGSVFFLYCPFSGERLRQVLEGLEPIARTREIRVCCVDLPLPPCPWLELASPERGELTVHRSTYETRFRRDGVG